jgi:sugar phosphate isomerase/epimerase
MKFGICASFRDIVNLKTVNFDYLEENVQRFLIPERPQEEFDAQLREARQILPLPIETANSFLPSDLVLVATPEQQVDTRRLEQYVKTALRRAEQSGIRIIVFGSGNARKCPPGYAYEDAKQQLADHLATWSRWAREHGVTLVLEPLRYEETNILNTVAESGALVSSIADSGARLLADTYHMACNREDPETVLPWASLLSHVHVAELQDRAAPGHYGEDFKPYFSALHRAGYDQRISIECRWFDFVHEIDPALATLKSQWVNSFQEFV